MGEYREFKAHPNLIQSVVLYQAGTLEKAIMELFMNAGDGKATEVHLTIDENGFVLRDNGRGFAGDNDGGKLNEREAIERNFEYFGSPHVEGDAQWGRFRSGRGQILSFAQVTWETGNYRLAVDFRRRPGYELNRMGAPVQGCIVRGKFYDLEDDLHWVVDKLKKAVRYMQLAIFINGERVTIPLHQEKWDDETPEAYFKFTTSGGMAVYNMGVIVDFYSGQELGNGIVVTKSALAVNFARNDVQEKLCPIWRKIKARLREQVRVQIRRGHAGDDDRAAIIKQIVTGEAPLSVFGEVPLITDVTGRHHPIKALSRVETLAVAKRGDQFGDKAMQRRQAFVIAQETLDRFGTPTLEEFVTLIRKITDEQRAFGCYIRRDLEVRTVAQLTGDLHTTHVLLAEHELTPVERQMVQMLNHLSYRFMNVLNLSGFVEISRPRKFYAGISNVALAWTDGSTQIVIRKDQLAAAAKDGLTGMIRLLALVVHEYLHTDTSIESHIHTPAFYEAFHNIMVHAPATVEKKVRLPYTIHNVPERMLSTLEKVKAQDAKKAARKGAKKGAAPATPEPAPAGLDDEDDGPIYEDRIPAALAA